MSTQTDLKTRLLSNTISKKEFLKHLLDLDQETPHHEECFENVVVMESEDVKSLFMNSTDISLKYSYLEYLRIFYFHSFQELECRDFKDSSSISYLEKAHEISKDLLKALKELDPDDIDSFTPYVAATFHYMKNDLESLRKDLSLLEDYHKLDPEFSNVDIVRRLYKNLSSYGNVNYTRDY